MKYIILLITLAQPVFGFYAGLGFSWNTVDESFQSYLVTDEDKSGQDRYITQSNRLSPKVELGHHFFLCDGWVASCSAEWNYLDYKTANINSSVGQILPNASFSSINIFGPNVIRDFTSKTRLYNEVKLLGSIGKNICSGFAYLGIGPALFNASNTVYVSSVHTPNGTGNHLISTSVKKDLVVWGGVIKTGYQYYLSPDYFLNASYSYLLTGRFSFHNAIDTDIFNGSDTPGSTTLFLKRSILFSVQEFSISMNMLF